MTVDPFFIHVFCRAGWQTIYEVVMHNRTYKEAQSFMDSTVLFNRAGWKAVMGIEKSTGKPVLNHNPQLAKTNQKEEIMKEKKKSTL